MVQRCSNGFKQCQKDLRWLRWLRWGLRLPVLRGVLVPIILAQFCLRCILGLPVRIKLTTAHFVVVSHPCRELQAESGKNSTCLRTIYCTWYERHIGWKSLTFRTASLSSLVWVKYCKQFVFGRCSATSSCVLVWRLAPNLPSEFFSKFLRKSAAKTIAIWLKDVLFVRQMLGTSLRAHGTACAPDLAPRTWYAKGARL